MVIVYFFIFLVSVGLFFLASRFGIYLRLIISIIFFLVASLLFTLFVIKKATAPMPGKTFTLEQWKQKVGGDSEK